MKQVKIIMAAAVVVLVVALGVWGFTSLSHQTQRATEQRQARTVTSKQILNAKQTFWDSQANVTAQSSSKGVLSHYKYAKSESVVATPWIFHKGQLGGYTRIGYTELKARLRQLSSGSTTKTHFATIKQLNRALAQAKAGLTIKKYSDLLYYRNGTVSVQSTGFIARGNHLYALSMTYGSSSDELGDVDVAQIYTRKEYQAPRRHLSQAQIAGYWSAGNYDAVQVQDGQLFSVNSTSSMTSASRFNVQDLAKISTQKLYASNYATRVAEAMTVGYTIPQATSLVANDIEYTYLFLSANKMVRIKGNAVTTFTKSQTSGTAAKMTPAIKAVFAAADKQKQGEYADSVSSLSDGTYEVVFVHTLDTFTETNYMDQRNYQQATIHDDQVTFKEM